MKNFDFIVSVEAETADEASMLLSALLMQASTPMDSTFDVLPGEV